MSETADLAVSFDDLASFIGALADIGRDLVKSYELATSDGVRHPVEAVFDDGVGRKAGIRKTAKGFAIVKDCHGLTPAQRARQDKSVSQVVQRYSYRKVVKQLQSQGYTVAEEKNQADGSIRLVARKWEA
ncbi:MAG: DUF1257 domain-containing protein [Elusimicrobia bacterium]|nr:DUF1257 domain-containing protein [Elusimicrobiota bacterium]